MSSPTFTWSLNDAAASVLVSKKVVLENVILKIQLAKKQFDVKIFQDEASIENAISLMVLLYFEYDEATIQNRMELLYPVEMRLKVKTESIIAASSMTVIVLIFNP
jgi:alanine racemase